MKVRRYRVTGRVQGVFFRASAQERALAVGLTGWVRNRSDGSVELEACGEQEALNALEKWLWQGPEHARVDTVEVDEMPQRSYRGFEIR